MLDNQTLLDISNSCPSKHYKQHPRISFYLLIWTLVLPNCKEILFIGTVVEFLNRIKVPNLDDLSHTINLP
jgi:hypothetical protein